MLNAIKITSWKTFSYLPCATLPHPLQAKKKKKFIGVWRLETFCLERGTLNCQVKM